MNIERGDSIKFGEQWCKEHGSEDLIGKTIKLTPQYFEEDNGIYTYESECPGIYDESDDEAHSIYHLFGNDLSNILDCELIKGTEEDKEAYQKIIQDEIDKENEYWANYV
jgi:hypothetical protein